MFADFEEMLFEEREGLREDVFELGVAAVEVPLLERADSSWSGDAAVEEDPCVLFVAPLACIRCDKSSELV